MQSNHSLSTLHQYLAKFVPKEDLAWLKPHVLYTALVCDTFFRTFHLPYTPHKGQKDLVFNGLLHIVMQSDNYYLEIAAPPAWGKTHPFNLLALILPSFLSHTTSCPWHTQIHSISIEPGTLRFELILNMIPHEPEPILKEAHHYSDRYLNTLRNILQEGSFEQPLYQLPWSIHLQTLTTWNTLIQTLRPNNAAPTFTIPNIRPNHDQLDKFKEILQSPSGQLYQTRFKTPKTLHEDEVTRMREILPKLPLTAHQWLSLTGNRDYQKSDKTVTSSFAIAVAHVTKIHPTSNSYLAKQLSCRLSTNDLIYQLLPWLRDGPFYSMGHTLPAQYYLQLLKNFTTLTRIIDSFLYNNPKQTPHKLLASLTQLYARNKKQLISTLQSLPDEYHTPDTQTFLTHLTTPKIFIFDESDIRGSTTINSRSLQLLLITGTIILKASGTMKEAGYHIDSVLSHPVRYRHEIGSTWKWKDTQHLFQHALIQYPLDILTYVGSILGRKIQSLIKELCNDHKNKENVILYQIYLYCCFCQHPQIFPLTKGPLHMHEVLGGQISKSLDDKDLDHLIKSTQQAAYYYFGKALIHEPTLLHDPNSVKLIYADSPSSLLSSYSIARTHLPWFVIRLLNQALRLYKHDHNATFPNDIIYTIASHIQRTVKITPFNRKTPNSFQEVFSTQDNQTRGINLGERLESLFNIHSTPLTLPETQQAHCRLGRQESEVRLQKHIYDFILYLPKKTILSSDFYTAISTCFSNHAFHTIWRAEFKHITLFFLYYHSTQRQRHYVLQQVVHHRLPIYCWLDGASAYAHVGYCTTYLNIQASLSTHMEPIKTAFKELDNLLNTPIHSFRSINNTERDKRKYDRWKDIFTNIWQKEYNISNALKLLHAAIYQRASTNDGEASTPQPSPPQSKAPCLKRKRATEKAHVLNISHATEYTESKCTFQHPSLKTVLKRGIESLAKYQEYLTVYANLHPTEGTLTNVIIILTLLYTNLSSIPKTTFDIHHLIFLYDYFQRILQTPFCPDPLKIAATELCSIWHKVTTDYHSILEKKQEVNTCPISSAYEAFEIPIVFPFPQRAPTHPIHTYTPELLNGRRTNETSQEVRLAYWPRAGISSAPIASQGLFSSPHVACAASSTPQPSIHNLTIGSRMLTEDLPSQVHYLPKIPCKQPSHPATMQPVHQIKNGAIDSKILEDSVEYLTPEDFEKFVDSLWGEDEQPTNLTIT